MFGLAHYETYIIWRGREHIGVVTLNPPDRFAIYTPDDPVKPGTEFLGGHGYWWWAEWVYLHEEP